VAWDTIVALATPPGVGAVGVIRVSGPLVPRIAELLLGRLPKPRFATLADFLAEDEGVIDTGIALFFPAPRSFTGEHVLELQGHGGPVVMDMLLRRTVHLGARPARPGEFSERAFLNGKIDLAQAEAVADLIESSTETAARCASRTLHGEFSRDVSQLEADLHRLRIFVEAAMDFPDEDLDLTSSPEIGQELWVLHDQLDLIRKSAHRGQLIREGLRVVIAGPPNAGKSSLLNALSATNAAIVTAVPGTTRDILRQEIQIDGLPVHLIDTAGLRSSTDLIELEGIRRARAELEEADHVLWVFDDAAESNQQPRVSVDLPRGTQVTLVRNKIDLTGFPAGCQETEAGVEIALSAHTGGGFQYLREHLKSVSGYGNDVEGQFLARRRHLAALDRVRSAIESAVKASEQGSGAELIAEDLRLAHRALGEITGEVTSDDLLASIFSSFCIGK
jgi:tRNA modification GTPase